MLEQLLKQLQQGGAYSVPALARQFSVSEQLVEQMLAELVRLGYLHPLDTCNLETCAGCPQHASCRTQRPVQTWEVVKD
jgi:hypothetical protein